MLNLNYLHTPMPSAGSVERGKKFLSSMTDVQAPSHLMPLCFVQNYCSISRTHKRPNSKDTEVNSGLLIDFSGPWMKLKVQTESCSRVFTTVIDITALRMH